MVKRPERTGLGRGLSALMADIEPARSTPEAETPASPRGLRRLPVDRIAPNPDQPRRTFAESALEELAASIREKGVIQPLIVRPDPTRPDGFQIVAGERRWRAAQRAQLHELPVIVREFDDTEVLEVAIIENIQRADLNALEEAQGYRQLIDRFGHTQEQLAQALGKSRSHIANMMRLLALPEPIQELVRGGQLSAGHARALLTAEDPVGLARKAVAQGWSVRDVEKHAKPSTGSSKPKARATTQKDADTVALEGDLSAAVGMPVSIDHDTASGEGRVTIRYKDLAALDDLIRLLSAG
ncbi:ParB/RepB/Spo0J family partition protein [Roseicyclus persicicus]|uniref:ParB/RepB/Spo0J family partition protein n=1 Tax=Roseicyclus persicicus TaxID=2650661 RepID=A0A7X6JZE9_9RHOB|nr:ParB/RepB/Spo0J family partition protein [Roseibacterium persicicum]NKX45100.1 ParB/RepB/Spo0J family partition protein [Roseibacterium persicicum]